MLGDGSQQRGLACSRRAFEQDVASRSQSGDDKFDLAFAPDNIFASSIDERNAKFRCGFAAHVCSSNPITV